jgi:hypothetical protein
MRNRLLLLLAALSLATIVVSRALGDESKASDKNSTDKKSPDKKSPDKKPAEEADWHFLDNGKLRLGVKKSSGGAIAWLSTSESKRNIVNHFDRGRLIQQSYYGDADGSLWNKQPWRWNPVQGGDWKGKPARLLKLEADEQTLYAKTLPKHWASGDDLPETSMEQWIALRDDLVHVRYRFTYSGERKHAARHQEVPAIFVQPEFSTLVLYDGDKPWSDAPLSRSEPKWPNEYRKITEHWAAYVDEHDYGLAAYVPKASELTCYRFGDGDARRGACSYFAPIATFAVEPGLEWEYDLYLTLGKVDDIRRRFGELK